MLMPRLIFSIISTFSGDVANWQSDTKWFASLIPFYLQKKQPDTPFEFVFLPRPFFHLEVSFCLEDCHCWYLQAGQFGQMPPLYRLVLRPLPQTWWEGCEMLWLVAVHPGRIDTWDPAPEHIFCSRYVSVEQNSVCSTLGIGGKWGIVVLLSLFLLCRGRWRCRIRRT